MAPHTPLRHDLGDSATLAEKIATPSENENFLLLVGKTATPDRGINPKIPVFDQSNIRPVAEAVLKNPAADHHRGMVQGVSLGQVGHDLLMRKRKFFGAQMPAVLVDLAASSPQDISPGIGGKIVPLQLESIRQALVVGIHPGEKLPLGLRQANVDQFVEARGQADPGGGKNKVDWDFGGRLSQGTFRVVFRAVDMEKDRVPTSQRAARG